MTLKASTSAGAYIVVRTVAHGKVLLRESQHEP
jgi:hypothetical protein